MLYDFDNVPRLDQFNPLTDEQHFSPTKSNTFAILEHFLYFVYDAKRNI